MKSILIVDNNRNDINQITAVLNKQGYQKIDFAVSGEEGIEKAKNLNPDLAVVKEDLPDIVGYEVCRFIKSLEGLKTKVIILNEKENSGYLNKARECGAVDCVAREEDYQSLSNSVRDLIRK